MAGNVLEFTDATFQSEVLSSDVPEIDRVVLAPDALTIELNGATPAVSGTAAQRSSRDELRPSCPVKPTVTTRDERVTLRLDIQIKKLDGKRLLFSPDGRDMVSMRTQDGPGPAQPHLVRAIAQAWWFHRVMLDGTSLTEVAARGGCSASNVKQLVPLTTLGPPILAAVLTGTIARSTTLNDLKRAAKHLNWRRQADHLGLKLPT